VRINLNRRKTGDTPVPFFPTRGAAGLLSVFGFTRKKDLEKYSREVTIYGCDFANFVLACTGSPSLPLFHRLHYVAITPPHLELTRESLSAL